MSATATIDDAIAARLPAMRERIAKFSAPFSQVAWSEARAAGLAASYHRIQTFDLLELGLASAAEYADAVIADMETAAIRRLFDSAKRRTDAKTRENAQRTRKWLPKKQWRKKIEQQKRRARAAQFEC
jgi:hypothetical protein